METYRYIISFDAIDAINTFYEKVAMKYSSIYPYEDMMLYIDNTIDSIYSIDKHLPPRIPNISRWLEVGYSMTHIGSWYFAYHIDGDTIIVEDACHEQNMHN